MKWILFAVELLLLFATFNALFMVPGPFDWFNVVAACIGISVSAVCAWFSGKRFLSFRREGRPSWKDLAGTPPAIVWLPLTVAYVARLIQFTIYSRQ